MTKPRAQASGHCALTLATPWNPLCNYTVNMWNATNECLSPRGTLFSPPFSNPLVTCHGAVLPKVGSTEGCTERTAQPTGNTRARQRSVRQGATGRAKTIVSVAFIVFHTITAHRDTHEDLKGSLFHACSALQWLQSYPDETHAPKTRFPLGRVRTNVHPTEPRPPKACPARVKQCCGCFFPWSPKRRKNAKKSRFAENWAILGKKRGPNGKKNQAEITRTRLNPPSKHLFLPGVTLNPSQTEGTLPISVVALLVGVCFATGLGLPTEFRPNGHRLARRRTLRNSTTDGPTVTRPRCAPVPSLPCRHEAHVHGRVDTVVAGGPVAARQGRHGSTVGVSEREEALALVGQCFDNIFSTRLNNRTNRRIVGQDSSTTRAFDARQNCTHVSNRCDVDG